MEEFKPLSSENIIKKLDHTAVSIRDTDLAHSIARLENPIKNIEYSLEGQEEIVSGEYAFNFAYSSIQQNEFSRLLKGLSNPQKVEDSNLYPEENIENWRKITSFNFVLGDTNIDLFKILPLGSHILFCPNASEVNGFVYKDSTDIYMSGDMATPATLAFLLHEIGHILDFKKMEELGVTQMVDMSENSDIAENLRRERFATAFALHAMRPYIKDETMRHDIVNLLKYYALKGYYYTAKKKVANRVGIRSHISDDWRGYEEIEEQENMDRMYYDGWEKWKKTEKYVQWKQKEENKNLDKFEEYCVWRSWVEDTGYQFWDDIREDE